MTTTTSLAQRMKAEFEARAARQKEAEASRDKDRQAREAGMQKFQKVCEELKPVWRPRFEEFAKQFGESVKVTPVATPEQREAHVVFKTELATITLSIGASASSDATKLVMDYNLLIVPTYFDYERTARLEMPLDKVDKDAIGKWLDDRFISCVKAYLSVQDNEFYLRRAMIEDPMTKARFLKEDAAAKLEHNGATVYFASEQSMKDYKKKHEIKG